MTATARLETDTATSVATDFSVRRDIDTLAAVRSPALWGAIGIRVANVADVPALDRLSELDSAPPITQPALVASVRQRVVAALSLSDGREIADPFLPTAELLELLRLRARQLRRRGARG